VGELLESISRPHLQPSKYDVENVAPVVIRTAEEGDLVARAILERAGAALGGSATVVARRLGMLEDEFEVVLAGGLFRSRNRFVVDALEMAILRVAPRVRLVRLDAPPVIGAVLMAMELATPEIYAGVRPRLATGIARALKEASV
jgi:N-acetylglucosamine kinase-like BadF-type ATPase